MAMLRPGPSMYHASRRSSWAWARGFDSMLRESVTALGLMIFCCGLVVVDVLFCVVG